VGTSVHFLEEEFQRFLDRGSEQAWHDASTLAVTSDGERT